jgi:putative transposase
MCLRFAFLLITRVTAWLRLSRREETWKTAEILILRHQVTVLQRHQARRPELNWADRALLATLFGVIPKARRHGLQLLVTPDTIVRWHRDIVRRAGRHGPGAARPAARRPAATSGRWSCGWRVRIPNGVPQDPRRTSRRRSAGGGGGGVEILKSAGIDPAPRRSGLAWSQFLRCRAEAILACDFFTADLPGGTQAHVLAVVEHATRRIRILGVTRHPTGEWTAQQARNLIMDLGDQAHRIKFMIRDRGSNFTARSTRSWPASESGPCSAMSGRPG